jgi:trimeric autotransporter adhesin
MRLVLIHVLMLGITAVLGACFEPSSPTGNPCGVGGYCPEGLVCHPQRNVCVRPIDGPDAGPAIDASPGPDNADLLSLELSVPGLAPAFAGDTTEYELAVSELVRNVHVVARSRHPDATVTVAGVPIPAGKPSAPIPLPPARTTVAITVTAPASNQKTYLVHLRPGGSMAQHIYTKADNAGEGDIFGWRVAIDGDTLAVAASYEASCATGVHPAGQGDNGCVGSGAVYVFRRRGSTWEPEAYLKPFNTDIEDEFGVSLALDGDTLAVGAFHEDSGVPGDGQNDTLSNSGAAYVFRRVDGAWQQDAYLKANSPQEDQEFGWSVAVAGDLVAVGARLEDGSDAMDSGAVYLFRRNVSRWIPEARLEAPAPVSDDFFGYSVAAAGDGVAVGACGHGCPPAGRIIGIRESAGAVHVFRRSGAAWVHEAALAPQSPDPADAFGRAVAMAGDLLIIGAPSEDSKSRGVDQDQDDDSVSGSGAAYVFRKSGPSWTQEAYLKAINTDLTDRFGASVAIAGELVAVGALGESSCATGIDGDPEGCADEIADEIADNSGAVYLYHHTGVAWSTLAYVKASNTAADDEFGTSVALSEDALVVGAPYEDHAGARIEPGPEGGRSDSARPESGAVYLFH